MCQISLFKRKIYYKHLKPLTNWLSFYFYDFVFCKTLPEQVVLILLLCIWKRPIHCDLPPPPENFLLFGALGVTIRFCVISVPLRFTAQWVGSDFRKEPIPTGDDDPMACFRAPVAAASCPACNPCLQVPKLFKYILRSLGFKTILDVHLTR